MKSSRMFIHLFKGYIIVLMLLSLLFLFVDYETVTKISGFSFKEILGFLMVLQLLITAFSVVDAQRIDNDIFSYRSVPQVITCLYAIVTPLAILFDQATPGIIGYYMFRIFDEATVIEVYFLFILLQIGMIIGANMKCFMIKNIFSLSLDVRRTHIVAWFLFYLSLIPYAVLVLSGRWSMEITYTDTVILMAQQNVRNRVYLYLDFLMLFSACVVIFTSIYRKKYKTVFFILLFSTFLTIVKPSRGLLFSTFIVAVMCFHYLVRHITIRTAIILGVILSLLSIVIVGIRSGSLAVMSTTEKLARSNEGRGVFENTYVVYDYVRVSGDYKWGQTYLVGIVRLVPSWILPVKRERPLPIWLIEELIPVGEGVGRMFSLVAEVYMNFHVWGPLVLGILIAYGYKILYLSATRDRKTFSFLLIVYIYFASQYYYLLRGTLTDFVARSEAFILLPSVLMIILGAKKMVTTMKGRHSSYHVQ